MPIRRALSPILAACLISLAACSTGNPLGDADGRGGPVPMGHIAYQPPLLPIEFFIDTAGNIGVNAKSPKIVTPIGVFTISAGAVKDLRGDPLPPEPADVTQVVICQGAEPKRCHAYQIGSGRKMRITMDGRFVQDIERNRVTIEAAPGSTITVTDNGPPSRVGEAHDAARLAVEEFTFFETSPHTNVDLEKSRSGIAADLSYDHISGRLAPVNGAKVARVEKYGAWSTRRGNWELPSEYECQQATGWSTTFAPDAFDDDSTLACVKTAESDLGVILVIPDTGTKPISYRLYSKVWVR
ncbi:hypothetical protein Ssi03_17930 [Sphaerisporangium siamense]|uniref:Uncharacterized protein n=1 Tax=Sphaerisporangium siamense TaxID=795645 RepID=A0A7W7DDV4_9ACTN|nr:hypothetical protein [Sphaerisporangium siamense]MBB4704998.1 hypothetical protein [Sphaerisporangium siamense]GII83803.1 hypothetical protein Ssi03_17930 [Sphaerisporangium siamense]